MAFVMDLFSRKWVGWALDDVVDCRVTGEALRMAFGQRPPASTLGPHSDRGVQYAAVGYRAVLVERGITRSMSRKGHGYDNAPMKSANGTLKTERGSAQRYQTRAQAKADLIAYIGYDNTERRHSALGYQRPAEFERQWKVQEQPAGASPTAEKGEAQIGTDERSPVVGQL